MNHREHLYTSQSAQPQPVSQIEAAICEIGDGLHGLQSAIKRLHGRLEPVLSEVCVNAESGVSQSAPASPTPIVRQLNSMAAMLAQECAALQDLERRLAL